MDSKTLTKEGGVPQTAENKPDARETVSTRSIESIFNSLEILRPESVLRSDNGISVITGNLTEI